MAARQPMAGQVHLPPGLTTKSENRTGAMDTRTSAHDSQCFLQ
jgi:hypothetical protein